MVSRIWSESITKLINKIYVCAGYPRLGIHLYKANIEGNLNTNIQGHFYVVQSSEVVSWYSVYIASNKLDWENLITVVHQSSCYSISMEHLVHN